MSDESLPGEIRRHYESTVEARRLFEGTGPLEMARTQEIVTRVLGPPPAVVLDVGGGPGAHALWLAGLGYKVHLLDIVPLHIEQAIEASRQSAGAKLASAQVGDARRLPQADASADAVLLLGPLYHLVHRADRIAALREARRVLRAGGVVLAAGISRFASLLDGLFRRMLDEAGFAAIVRRDLIDGQHSNPTDNPAWFTTAFFHRPEELGSEISEAGLRHEATLAVEGPGWLLRDFDDHWGDPHRRRRLLDAIRSIEGEPALMGCSAHLLAVGRKP